MKTLVCLLEEKSAKAMLEIILPKLLFNINFKYITFSGKQDLLKNIRLKLKNYRTPETVFLIMCDKDSQDCRMLKRKIEQSIPAHKKAKIRIACHELESFYLGDLQAVDKAFGLNLARYQKTTKYRNPDDLIVKPAEKLKILTQEKYQKIQGSRLIAQHLKLDNSNQSVSFVHY